MLIFILIIVAVFTGLFFKVRNDELNKGRKSYNLKDFILELFNHTGDSSNYKR